MPTTEELLTHARTQHATLTAAAQQCDPNSERYRQLRAMIREWETDIALLEYERVNAMAERLVNTGRMIGDVRESHGLREHVQPHTRARGKR